MPLNPTYNILVIGNLPDKEFGDLFMESFSNKNQILPFFSFNTVYIEQNIIDNTEFDFDALSESIINADSIIIFGSTMIFPLLSLLGPNVIKHFGEKSKKNIIPIILRKIPWKNISWIRNWTIYPSIDLPLSNLTESGILDTFTIISTKIKNHMTKPFAHSIPLSAFETSQQKHDLFISYSHADGTFLELLISKLETKGIIDRVWSDTQIEAGEKWMPLIDKVLSEAKVILVIMSPKAKQSDYVTYEWSFALGKGKVVIPIMIEETNLHPVLETIQTINFINWQTRDWDGLFNRIENLINIK